MKVTVFSKEACNDCDRTKEQLGRHEIPFEEVRVDQDETALAELMEKGVRAMPYVRVELPNGEVRDWTGFRYEEIRGLGRTIKRAIAA